MLIIPRLFWIADSGEVYHFADEDRAVTFCGLQLWPGRVIEGELTRRKPTHRDLDLCENCSKKRDRMETGQ